MCRSNLSNLFLPTILNLFTVWHFYLGGSMSIVELTSDGKMYRETIFGQNILEGEVQQMVVKGGTWFGCFPGEHSDFSFVGCTVAPGFDFQDFELGSRAKLIENYPTATEMIKKLTEGLP